MPLTFSYPPPARIWSTNDDRRIHPMQRHKLTTAWRDAAWAAWQQLPLETRQSWKSQPAIVQMSIPVPDKRRRDPHNYCGTILKATIDGLVLAHVWPDDTPNWVGHREPMLVQGKAVSVTLHEWGGNA